MSTAAIFTTAKMCKRAKCPSTEDWGEKMWCIGVMDHHSAFEKKEFLQCVTTKMILEDIMLSELSQSQKDNY